MGLVLTNNVSALTAQGNLNSTNNNLAKSLERLSTGLKVNRGADGPAALVISEQQRAQIAGIRTAIDNTNKAVSLVQTGEGALNEINGLLGKVRGLALDSANVGVNDTNTLAANQSEIANALNTITNIANTTQFGSKKLLDGSRALSVSDNNALATASAAGNVASGTYTVNVTSAATRAANTAVDVSGGTFTNGVNETLSINGQDVSFAHGATAADSLTNAAAAINAAKDKTGVEATVVGGNSLRVFSTNFGSSTSFSLSVKSVGGADTSVLTGAAGSNQTVAVADGTNIAGTLGGVQGTGTGNTLSFTNGIKATFSATAADATTSDATATSVTVGDGNALQFQIGANAGQTASIAISDARASALGTGVSGRVASLNDIDVNKLLADRTLSTDIVKVIDSAINEVSTQRGTLGAFQSNTLQSNLNNLQATLQNTTAAESTIRDTDFAQEIANFTKLQTQLQAGSTVLGNANQLTQLVAGLLRG